MADLIRAMGAPIGPPVKDKLGSPSTESEDGGGDIAELAADLELDEPDGPSTNGKFITIRIQSIMTIKVGIESMHVDLIMVSNRRKAGSAGPS